MDWNSWLVVAENLGLARLRVSAYLNFLMILFDRVTSRLWEKSQKVFTKLGHIDSIHFSIHLHSYRNSKLTQKFKKLNQKYAWNKISHFLACLALKFPHDMAKNINCKFNLAKFIADELLTPTLISFREVKRRRLFGWLSSAKGRLKMGK